VRRSWLFHGSRGGRETRVGRKLEGAVVSAPGYLRIFENVPLCEERS